MLKKGLCLLIGIMMLFCQINVVHATNLASGAESAILIDANSQQVLYHKNETKRLYPASTTKIMTMILLFEAIKEKRINWNDTLSCSAYAASMGGSQVYLEENEKMSVNELFKCVAIASANDASVLIGEGIAGSHQEFVKMMNEKAKQLKLVNTHFKNCTGLHDVEHYTCAKDLATMGAYLIKIGGKKLFSVTSLYDSYIREKNHQKFWLVNTNKLLKQYQGVDGLKTGYTKEAGYWYKNAKGYAAFKQRVAPLMYSSLINAPVSSKGTPNLIITGEFHDSITAVPIDKGLRIESVGISFRK